MRGIAVLASARIFGMIGAQFTPVMTTVAWLYRK